MAPSTNRLHELRTEVGAPAEFMAWQLGVSVKTIYNWEHAARVKPYQEVAYRSALDAYADSRGSEIHRDPTFERPKSLAA